jgi:endonuclease/exonuclease/phosphatase family metal-dependent hydrolase
LTQKITVLSWNVLAPLWVHPDFYPGVHSKDLDLDSRRKVFWKYLEEILEKNPTIDVIGFQEAMPSEMMRSELRQLLQSFDPTPLSVNEPTCWSSWLRGPYQENGTILFLRKDRFSDIQSRREFISDDGNAATIVSCSLNGRKIYFINSHIDTESRKTREQQIHKIQKMYENDKDNLRMGMDSVTFWLGDFNVTSDTDLIQYVISKGWRDLLKEKGMDSPTVCTARSLPRHIDYIFGIGPIQTIHAFIPQIPVLDSSASYCAHSLRHFGSDHLPVLATTSLLI